MPCFCSQHPVFALGSSEVVIGVFWCMFFFLSIYNVLEGLPRWLSGKESDCQCRRGSGRAPREGHGNPLQYSCLENPMDRGAWGAAVHGVAKSWTRLSTHALTDVVSKLEVQVS